MGGSVIQRARRSLALELGDGFWDAGLRVMDPGSWVQGDGLWKRGMEKEKDEEKEKEKEKEKDEEKEEGAG
jgi:hypothetical protein